MEMLFQNVPTLCNLDMTFGVKDVGMEYERSKFGMKMSDVTSLQKALRVTETLTILSLPCNLLDDNTMRILATGLQGNSTITALDLSHNKIADRGVKTIAKLLRPHERDHLAQPLRQPRPRRRRQVLWARAKAELEPRDAQPAPQPFGDEGGKMLLDGLGRERDADTPQPLEQCARPRQAQQMGSIVQASSSLQSLDLSCNVLSEEAGRLLRDGLQQNTTLTSLDLRLNQISVDTAAAIDEICKANKLDLQKQRREAFEAQREAAFCKGVEQEEDVRRWTA